MSRPSLFLAVPLLAITLTSWVRAEHAKITLDVATAR